HHCEMRDQPGPAATSGCWPFSGERQSVEEGADVVLLARGVGGVGIFGVLLLDFVSELVFAALILGARDDLIVDAGNDLFDHLTGRCCWGWSGSWSRGLARSWTGRWRRDLCGHRQTGESNQNETNQKQAKFLHRMYWATTLPGLAGKGWLGPMKYFTPSERTPLVQP